MDNQFNSKLQSWLNDDSRTIEDGCLLLLQLENNQIHYHNLLHHPNKVAVMKYLVLELQKRLTIRLANITHQEVAEMDEKVKVIIKKHFAYQDGSKKVETNATQKGTSNEEFRKGKRDDHDQLPEEIQARYVENLSLLQRMREVHLKLRSLSLEQVSCPDSERYPFLKELIELDKHLHENWEVYDHYVADANSTRVLVSSPVEEETAKTEEEPSNETDNMQGDKPDDETAEGASSEQKAETIQEPEDVIKPAKKTTKAKTAKAAKTTRAKK